jgi:flagellar assembly protein FliH
MPSRIVPPAHSARVERVRWTRSESGNDPDGLFEAPMEGAIASHLEAIERDAAARIEQVRQLAYQEGYRQGKAEAEQAANEKLGTAVDGMVKQLALSVEQMLVFRQKIRAQLEQDLVRLSVVIARRVLGRELTVDLGALLGVVKAAVSRVEAREIHRLRVSKPDYDALDRRLVELLPEQVEVVADTALPRGSVILETARGELDAGVETQLAEIDRGLTDLAGRR